MNKKKVYGILGVIGVVSLLTAFTGNGPNHLEQVPWKAPASADSLKSPFAFSPDIVKKGEDLYFLYCWSCHGDNGMGDGAAGASLSIKPANFHEDRVIKQSDGAVFWKMTTGRGSMPSFKEVLKDEERWQLVSFIRKLSKEK